MSGSVRIARLGGISIEIHFTFLLVMLWAAAQGAFAFGGIRGAAYGVLGLSLLFACVLLHELGHSLQARLLGVGVERITLLPIGGMAQLESLHGQPVREFLITLAGPAVNLALAVVLGGALVAMGLSPTAVGQSAFRLGTWQPSLQSTLLFLFGTNVVLFAFNMLPAYPMDGGRLVRATLALVLDYETATSLATLLGRLMAVGLLVVGLFGLPFLGLSFNPALAIIAVVIYVGASEEAIVARRRRRLTRIAVGQIASPQGQTLSPSDPVTLHLAQGLMAQHAALPVVVGSRLIGLMTPRELRRSVGRPGTTTVAHVMRTDFPVFGLGETLWSALEVLRANKLGAAPVVHDDALHGMVSLEDINRALRRRR